MVVCRIRLSDYKTSVFAASKKRILFVIVWRKKSFFLKPVWIQVLIGESAKLV
jgi:hypothetical protein